MAMARRDSVTVSMAALMMGTFSWILRESCVWVLASAGTTSESAGTSRTSSKVRASGTGKSIIYNYLKRGSHFQFYRPALGTDFGRPGGRIRERTPRRRLFCKESAASDCHVTSGQGKGRFQAAPIRHWTRFKMDSRLSKPR